MKVQRRDLLKGELHLPGDKSISHRAAILASMSAGETVIRNYSVAADCQTTLTCLRHLGVQISKTNDGIRIKGVGKRGFHRPAGPLYCGNSGTTARLLAGLLAGQTFDCELTGDASLTRRPMARILGPLQQMGAKIESDNGHMPLRISGGRTLIGTDHEMQIASAQVKSCILIAGLLATGETTILERSSTRDHTERMLDWLGVDVGTDHSDAGKTISVNGDAVLTARDIEVPGDVSSAAFFIVAAACLNGSEVVIPAVGLNPTRTTFISLLSGLGARVEVSAPQVICGEPVGSISVHGGLIGRSPVKQNQLNGDIIGNIIDEIPILAILGTQIEGGIEIRDAAELRLKESDRISAVVNNLKRMGADVSESPDGFRVGQSTLQGAVVDSYGDHRIAMAFAVAGLLATGETEITGAECVDISFPGFFDVLNKMALAA